MVSYKVEEEGDRFSSTKFNQPISELVGGMKVDNKLKERIHAVDLAKEKLDGNTIEVATGIVSLFNSIPPKEMAGHQCQNNQISPIIKYVEKDQKLPKKFMYQIRSKHSHKLGIGLYLNKEFYVSCIFLMRLNTFN